MKFTVFGTPEPQGSTKAFVPKGWKRPVLTSDNAKLKPWRQQIAGAAAFAMGEMLPTKEAVVLNLDFYFARPKSLAKRVVHKTTRPDRDKLERAVADALTGIIFVDDAQIVDGRARKLFGLPERVEIEIELAPTSEDAQPTNSPQEEAQQCLQMS